MARKIKNLVSLQGHDFKKYIRTEAAPDVRMRLLALAHIQEGKACRAVAAIIKVGENAVQQWVKLFAEGGIDGLRRKKGQGCRKRVDLQKLPQIKTGILALKPLSGGRIRRTDIQAYLEKEWNVVYRRSAIYALLKHLGIVWISARSKHPSSSQIEQDAFKKKFKKK
jgi:transposase